ncbi:MAG: hypothetical protein HWN68_14585 [Desulfobacterales bacterium]|nr:hypothetical protein [Desulfobacterales bacterium]
MKEIEQVKCSLCGKHTAIERKGTGRLQKDKTVDQAPYEFRFDHVDLETAAFVSVREARGRGQGLPEIRRITLKEAVENDTYKDLRQSLLNQCYGIMKILTGSEK